MSKPHLRLTPLRCVRGSVCFLGEAQAEVPRVAVSGPPASLWAMLVPCSAAAPAYRRSAVAPATPDRRRAAASLQHRRPAPAGVSRLRRPGKRPHRAPYVGAGTASSVAGPAWATGAIHTWRPDRVGTDRESESGRPRSPPMSTASRGWRGNSARWPPTFAGPSPNPWEARGRHLGPAVGAGTPRGSRLPDRVRSSGDSNPGL